WLLLAPILFFAGLFVIITFLFLMSLVLFRKKHVTVIKWNTSSRSKPDEHSRNVLDAEWSEHKD
ncbi:MAG TPA: hypothetical protein PL060_06590, partial [bacterium]|nr:hypothetical protein [bacterium]